MGKLKKFFSSVWGIISSLAIIVLTVWALFRQLAKNKVNKDEIRKLRTGLNKESERNEKVIKETLKSIELNNKILKKKEEDLAKMSLKDKVKEAKKLGY